MSLFVPSLYSFGGCIFVVNRWAIPATKRIYTAHTFFYIYIVPVHHIQKIWFPTDRPPTNGLYRLNMYLSFDFIKRFFPIYTVFLYVSPPESAWIFDSKLYLLLLSVWLHHIDTWTFQMTVEGKRRPSFGVWLSKVSDVSLEKPAKTLC